MQNKRAHVNDLGFSRMNSFNLSSCSSHPILHPIFQKKPSISIVSDLLVLLDRVDLKEREDCFESTQIISSGSIIDFELDKSDRLRLLNSFRTRFFNCRIECRLDSFIVRNTPSYVLKLQERFNTGVVKEVAMCPNSSSDIVENVSIDCVLEQYHFGSNTLITPFHSS